MSGTPQVEEAEILYRQLAPGGDPLFYSAGRSPPVHSAAFIPNNHDLDGLSLIRKRFRTDIWAAFRREQPDVRYRLACLVAEGTSRAALQTGFPDFPLNASPDRLDDEHGEPWAHVVAAAVNRTDYDRNREVKKWIKEWALAMAEAASSAVIGPFSEPANADSYRPAPD